jgi:S1-C subfamily serine protease
MKPGQSVTFSVLREKGKPLTDINITLEERPRQSNTAKRFFAEDLGFTAREIVFADTYQRRLPADSKGVIVDLIKPNSSAQSGKLQMQDMIVKLNQTPVASVDQFKSQYESFRKDHPRDAVVMEVRRGVNTEVVRIEPPQ